MKDLSMIVWLVQLGFSTAFPLAGFILLAVWLHDSCGWGAWVIWAGVIVGLCCAADGFRTSLKAMSRLQKGQKTDEPPPVSYNEHD